MVRDSAETTVTAFAEWAGERAYQIDPHAARLLLELLQEDVGVAVLADLAPGDLDELLTEVFPRRMSIPSHEHGEVFLATTRRMLEFAADTGELPAKDAERLRAEVDGCESRFFALNPPGHVVDDDSFGPDDFDPAAIREVFGLPDRLPPIRLPDEAELARTAKESLLIGKVRRLAEWNGDRREIDEYELTTADAEAASADLGLDADELGVLWEIAEELAFLEFDEDEEVATRGLLSLAWPGGADEDVLDVWEHAFAATFRTPLERLSALAGATELDFGAGGGMAAMLLFVARGDGIPLSEVDDLLVETAGAGLSQADARREWAAWARSLPRPAEVLTRYWTDLGAATVRDDVVRLTPLALHALRLQLLDAEVDIPLAPPVEEMTAADLVAFLVDATEDELDAEAAAWFSLQDAEKAAAELIAVAADGDPAERILATSLAGRLGAAAKPAWEQAVATPAVRPYAKIALAQLAGNPAEHEPDRSDLAWLLTDTLAAGAEQPGEIAQSFADAVPPGMEEATIDLIWRLDRPDASDVLTLLGAHHPDKKIAKLAKKAAFKARNAGR